ncbi:MAG: hypothetical protein ACO1O1_01190 [Adhaeribacter sp.]
MMTTPLLAQKKGWQDVVYLHNGSIIRGTLAKDPANGKVKIQTVGGNLFVFRDEEVKQVARELIRKTFQYPYTTGYLHMSEVALSLGNSSEANQKRRVDFSAHTFNGYQFASYLATGLTVGVDGYDGVTLLPLGLGLRGDLTKTPTRPFYSLDGGYSLDWLDNPMRVGNRQGGYFWSGGLGLKFQSKKNHAFTLGLAFRRQATAVKNPFLNGTSVTDYTFNRILFRLGLSI